MEIILGKPIFLKVKFQKFTKLNVFKINKSKELLIFVKAP